MMSGMAGVITIIAIVFASVAIITLGSVWMGTSYSAKKRGFGKGVSKRELDEIHTAIAQIRKDIADVKEQIAELIIIMKDAS
jgi:hypothetical protein